MQFQKPLETNLEQKKEKMKELWKKISEAKKLGNCSLRLRENVYKVQDEIAMESVRLGLDKKINYDAGREKLKIEYSKIK